MGFFFNFQLKDDIIVNSGLMEPAYHITGKFIGAKFSIFQNQTLIWIYVYSEFPNVEDTYTKLKVN